VQICTQKTKYF